MMPLTLLPIALFAAAPALTIGEVPVIGRSALDTTVAVVAPRRLRLDLAGGGAVRITGGESSVVGIRVYDGRRLCDDCPVRVEQTSQGLEIRSAVPVGATAPRAALRFEIDVPIIFDVQLESAGGEIQIDGVSGRVSGRTGHGKLSLRRLSGDVDLETASGDVTLRESFVNGRVHTRGGRVMLQDVNGNVSGTTSRGGVTQRRVTRGPTI